MHSSFRPLFSIPLALLFVLPFVYAAPPAPAFADDDRRDRLERRDRDRDDDRKRAKRNDRRDRQGVYPYRDNYLEYRTGSYQRRHPEFYRRGHRIDRLPGSHLRIVIGDNPYFYWEGIFARPHKHGYVVVRAPLGARVRHLPPGYVSFHIGPSRYFHVNATYYLWDNHNRDYVVVEKPRGADHAMAAGDAPDDLFIYPAQGQSDDERESDRFSCHVWSVAETGYDPVLADPASPGRRDYLRAMEACLEGRGYTVR